MRKRLTPEERRERRQRLQREQFQEGALVVADVGVAAIAGGQLLQRFGPGKSYLVVAGAMVVAALLVLRAPKLPAPTRPAARASLASD